MWRVYEFVTGIIHVFNQELLLIYLRQFDDGYVLYEECLTVEPDQRCIIEKNGVMTHSIENVEMLCQLTPYQKEQWNNLQ